MARYKENDLVEVFIKNRSTQELTSNRIQIVDVIETPGKETIYTGVLVMHHNKWVAMNKKKADSGSILERDFLESQIGVQRSRKI